eukprot:6532521-Alexandrium_andersonii.AAC.1
MVAWSPALDVSPFGSSSIVPEWPYLGARTASLDPAGGPSVRWSPPMLAAMVQGTWSEALGSIS